MTVNARGEEDVEPDTILEKVAKASGANFNFHKETQRSTDTLSGPVVRRQTCNHITRTPTNSFTKENLNS